MKAEHFEESMKYARRSIDDEDLLKYMSFAISLQQSKGFGSDFKFASKLSFDFPLEPSSD
ncbi:hypothetical protein LINPERPRIM_LOCUS38015 [Linum perenne]